MTQNILVLLSFLFMRGSGFPSWERKVGGQMRGNGIPSSDNSLLFRGSGFPPSDNSLLFRGTEFPSSRNSSLFRGSGFPCDARSGQRKESGAGRGTTFPRTPLSTASWMQRAPGKASVACSIRNLVKFL